MCSCACVCTICRKQIVFLFGFLIIFINFSFWFAFCSRGLERYSIQLRFVRQMFGCTWKSIMECGVSDDLPNGHQFT